nr:VTT domain-containing protein [uncultured Oscillibacter sp.]
MKRRIFPLLLWAVLGLAAWSCRSELTPEAVSAWPPGRSWLAVLALLGLYALKGLTAALPSTALAAAAGWVLPFPLALGTNLCGAAAAQAGPYFIGRRKQGALEALAARHPRLAALEAGPAGGREVFLLRLAGVLPVELVSLWLGAAGTPRRAYFAGGLLGSFPRVLSATALGAALWDLGGARFWASCVFGWALTGAALAVWGRAWAAQPRSFFSRRMSSPKKGRT